MASSAPLAIASASPLRMRLTRKTENTRLLLPKGTKASRLISAIMQKEVATINRFRPIRSARAPEGTSAQKMVTAQTELSRANCSMVRPKSRKRIVKTG